MIIVEELRDVPSAPLVSADDELELVVAVGLERTGIDYVDAHLLASVRAMAERQLLTHDKRLLGWRSVSELHSSDDHRLFRYAARKEAVSQGRDARLVGQRP
jgi:hypothetical protein